MPNEKKISEQLKKIAKKTYNEAWKFLDKKKLNGAEKISLLNLVHTSFYLWQQVPEHTTTNTSISLWQISRAYAHIVDGENALLFAEQNIKLCKQEKVDGFYLAYAYESAVRAFILLDNKTKAITNINLALKAIQHTTEKHTEQFFIDIENLKKKL